MKSKCFSLLIILLIAHGSAVLAETLQPADAKTVGMDPKRLALLDGIVQNAIEKEEIPGAVVLVARKGKIVYRKSFGIRSADPVEQQLTIDSVFDLASLTKVVATATSIMILVEEGKLSLSDKVSDHIPDFGKRRKKDITVQQLLTHFSGLRPDVDLDVPWTGYQKAIQLACSERPVAKPGERFIYSDINYFVLGELVQRISGMGLETFARERIFKPLGMIDTGYLPGDELKDRLVPTEKRDEVWLRGSVHDPTASRMGGVAGHAGLFATADDIAIWAQMILNRGAFNGSRILSPLGVLKMTTPQSPAGTHDWRGIGWDIETRFSTARGDVFPLGSFGHTGFTGTSLWIDPFTETIAILFTSRLYPNGEGNVVPLRARVASVIAAAVLDPPPIREYYFYRY